ncbi:alpha/beta fold hydrolase [Streptomyces flavotricini]|uniref:Alpha/beta fold hydrolase n=1 Tax=Streptomyces flavotricini TaxID=66888 RepID=A0ABS8E2X9_9ACTN|nr:alpha/beta fold hydrolase [Streptomyces flavotricini]MCC0095263.1 alpha/beta fold hydrolase [Streptomyces flavotricini]
MTAHTTSATGPGTSRWLKRLTVPGAPAPQPARARIVCLPHAGGGASAYQGWARHLPPAVELLAVQYPGRQDRLAEPCSETMEESAGAAAAALAALPVLPTVVFGHSMGALVAYETTLRLGRHAPHAAPVHLFVSGTAAPHRDREELPALDDASLVAYTRRQGGAEPEVYEIPELRELLLPSLRADFRLLTDYVPVKEPARTGVPVTAFGGDRDTGCPPEELASWGELTTAEFTSRVFPGGHFYLQGQEERLTALVAGALGAGVGAVGVGGVSRPAP